jgi:CRISPR-associated protein Cas2
VIVMILESVPASLRGELSRWLIEPYPNVFVGNVSAIVRDRLWDKCCKSKRLGGVVQAWSTNTEQRFQMRMAGDTRRAVVDMEGLQLVRIPEAKAQAPGDR